MARIDRVGLAAITALAASESSTRATTSAATPEARHNLPKSPASPSDIHRRRSMDPHGFCQRIAMRLEYRERRCWRARHFQRLPLRIITPSAASPIVPVTKTRSPLWHRHAVPRPFRNGAKHVMETTIGPGVIGIAPNSGQSKVSVGAQALRKPSPLLADLRGSASDNRKPAVVPSRRGPTSSRATPCQPPCERHPREKNAPRRR